MFDSIKIWHNKYNISEKYFVLLITCVWAPALIQIFNAIALRLPVLNVVVGGSAYILITWLAIVGSLAYILKNINAKDIFCYFVLLSLYGLQFILYPDNQKYLEEYFVTSMLATVPLFYIGLSWDVEKFDKLLFYIFAIFCIYSAYYFLFVNTTLKEGVEDGQSQMGNSYHTLFALLYVTWYTFRRFSFLGLIAIVVGVFSMFSYGTRGPIVTWFIFIIAYLLFFSKFKNKKYVIPVLTLVFYSMSQFYEEIALGLDVILNDLRFSTRITQMIIEDNLQNNSYDERLWIIERLHNQLNNGESMSYGLFGSWNYVTNYAHRIYWDLWFNFGYGLGSILMCSIAYLLIKASLANKTTINRGFFLLLLCDGLVTLFMSDYFMFRGTFWMLLGYCVRSIRMSKI